MKPKHLCHLRDFVQQSLMFNKLYYNTYICGDILKLQLFLLQWPICQRQAQYLKAAPLQRPQPSPSPPAACAVGMDTWSQMGAVTVSQGSSGRIVATQTPGNPAVNLALQRFSLIFYYYFC